MEPKRKKCPIVDVTDDDSKVRCCKEQYCIGIWKVRSHESGKIGSGQTGHGENELRHFSNQLKRTMICEFNLNGHYIYYRGQESLRINGVALTVNKRVQNAWMHLGAILKMTE